jgi:hypothetical protein
VAVADASPCGSATPDAVAAPVSDARCTVGERLRDGVGGRFAVADVLPEDGALSVAAPEVDTVPSADAERVGAGVAVAVVVVVGAWLPLGLRVAVSDRDVVALSTALPVALRSTESESVAAIDGVTVSCALADSVAGVVAVGTAL